VFRSRFHIIVYAIFFIAAMFVFMGIGQLIEIDKPAGYQRSAPTIYGSYFILIAGLAIAFFYASTLRIVAINNDTIRIRSIFDKIVINKCELDSINLLESDGETLATELTFKNGKRKIIPDNVYRNIHQFKQVLYDSWNDKISPGPFPQKNKLPGHLLAPQKFTGNFLLSSNCVTLVVCLIIISFLSVTRNTSGAYISLSIGISLVSVIIIPQSHYFVLAEGQLIVKNQFLFWSTRTYDLAEIILVKTEYPSRLSQSLRIVTRDFRSKSYSAGSLREKTWIALEERINSLGIPFS
jgi:hypothetical protein